jgi:hypothetical protein
MLKIHFHEPAFVTDEEKRLHLLLYLLSKIKFPREGCFISGATSFPALSSPKAAHRISAYPEIISLDNQASFTLPFFIYTQNPCNIVNKKGLNAGRSRTEKQQGPCRNKPLVDSKVT